MYDWLEQEMAAIKTAKFFVVSALKESGVDKEFDVGSNPSSYVEFMRKFGKAEFFRESSGCYAIGVLANPEKEIKDGDTYWYVGWYDESGVYLKEPWNTWDEWPVFEKSKFGRMKQVAESFDNWLRLRWETVKTQYSSRQWRKILRGPDPFTSEELKIVEARRKFHWRLLGVDKNCTMRFEIANTSDRHLAYLGVRVHGKRHGVWVSVALPVNHVPPGTKAIVEYGKFPPGMFDPDEIEVFEEPDPAPEDREFYWEFQSIPGDPDAGPGLANRRA